MANISATGSQDSATGTSQGRIFSVELPTSGQTTIQDFDPAHDKLDLGDNSVHAFIVVDTPEGVAFMDPWSGREVVLAGVSLGQLTVDSFVPVQNDHLRQDLSGALAWEHGIEEAPNTVYARSHEEGQIDRVAFDPAADVVDFRYYGSREQIYMVDGPEGVVIGNYATGQTLILLDVTVADLTPENFLFHNAQVNEDRLYLKLGFSEMPASQVVSRDDIPTVGTDVWPTEAGPGAAPTGSSGTTYPIEWKYGTQTALDFDPASDKLDFKYFHPNEFTVAEVNGSVVISIVGQNQTYTLDGVRLSDLAYSNILAVDGATNQVWHTLIDTAESDGPSLSVAAAQVAEGDAGESVLRFVVTLSEPAQGAVSVDYSTRNGSALAGSDFAAVVGTLTFAPGETTKTVDVAVHGDTAYELDETLQLVLSSASGARLVTASATGTITNDDASTHAGDPALSIADAAVVEGNDGAPHMMFDVTLSEASDHTVTVRYATQDGTAKAGSDFEAQSGLLTFAPGQTTAHVHVPLVGDTVAEADETFSVVLSAPSGATLSDATATGTITNDDTAVPPSGGDTIAFTVSDDWGAGFVGAMTLTPEDALNGWTVAFDAPFDISNIWNAEIVSHVGDHYVVRNASWNGAVPADGAVNFGFQASPGGGAATVSGFEVNGTPVGGEPTPELPVLAVGDAQVAEGDAGMTHLAFTVSLSEASDAPVSVHYATADGTATAASGDYSAASGTLTFAPGETTKTVHVMVNGDVAVEANETLSLKLSSPSGATVGDATGTGTILNDDAAAPPEPPVISVSNASVTEGGPGGTADGWFSTSGNQIVDADGNPVQIAGVNWFGFEGTNHAPDGLWTRNFQDMMDQMKEEGFNTIRLPFSSDMLHSDSISGIDYSQNPELEGLTPIEVMDAIVAYADEIGMKVILDHHRSSAGAGTSANGLWYDDAHSEAQWVDDWQMLAERYADNPAVIGADLHNEPYNGTWGGGGANDWAAAAERAGNAIGEVNPNWLIFVEGVGTYEGDSYWWGGNLKGVANRPIALDVSDKLVYSAHDYGNSVYAQPWFQDPDFAEKLPQIFDENWGYIYREGIAPVLVGEFGTKLEDPKDAPWLEALTSYMAGDFDNDGTIDIPAGETGISWTYWSWNPNSGDTGGILQDDWRTVNENKLAYLEPIQFDLGETGSGTGGSGTGDGAAEAVFVVSLSHASDEAVTVGYHTVAGTADATDFIGANGTLTFAPGETSKVVRIAIADDAAVETDEHFSLVLTDANGGVIGTAEGVATIHDNDVDTPILPSLSVADAGAEEGDAGAPGALLFAVHLSAPSDEAVTVSYRTVDGTAAAGSDYQGASGTLTFAPGETEATVRVPLVGDAAVESNERFSLVLTDAHGASIADGLATGTILNDDAAAPPAGGDILAFTVPDNWGSGFVGNMTLTPDHALNGWTVEFDAPFDISNIWNAEIVSHVGDHYVVRNASWNGNVAADSSVSFGFQASPGGGGAAASGFTVNGVSVGPESPAPAASTLAVESLAAADAPSATLLADDTLLTASLHVNAGENAFSAEVTLHNSGETTYGWALEIETPFEITGVTGAEILARTEDGYILGNAHGSGGIGENGDVTFSIAGTGRFEGSHFDILI